MRRASQPSAAMDVRLTRHLRAEVGGAGAAAATAVRTKPHEGGETKMIRTLWLSATLSVLALALAACESKCEPGYYRIGDHLCQQLDTDAGAAAAGSGAR